MGLFRRKQQDEGTAAPPVPPSAPMDLDAMRRQGEELSATVRQQGLTKGNLGDLTAYAKQAQAQAMQQMESMQQGAASASASGEEGPGALLRALGIDWSSDYVKRVQCPTCGGPKKLPSPSAYIYCDYCGALADYDFRRACSDGLSVSAGAEYAQTVNGLQPELTAARAAGDKDRYRDGKRKMYEAYVTACPHAVSHRIGDPDYRAKLIEFMAESNVATDFDPAFTALEEEMKTKVLALEWGGGSLMSRRTGGPSFRALVDVCERQAQRTAEVVDGAGLAAADPDRADDAVRKRMHHSLFSQGWLPMLGEEDAAWMIDALGLRGEYTKVEPPADAESRNCGGCGGQLTVLPGAKAVVCDHCGRTVEVGGAQVACANCGGALSFPVGVSHLQCPYCKTDTARVGLT